MKYYRWLSEGEIDVERDPVYGDSCRLYWYVGGQTDKSWQTAWHSLENLLDSPEGLRVDNILWSGGPSRCVSLRHGNGLAIRLCTEDEYQSTREIFGDADVIPAEDGRMQLPRPHWPASGRYGVGRQW